MKEFTRRKALIMIGGAAAATSSCSGAGTSDAVETDLTTSLAQSPTSAAEQAQAPEATSTTAGSPAEVSSETSETGNEPITGEPVTEETILEPPAESPIDGDQLELVEVISRRSWNAEPAGAGMKAHELSLLTLHHTAGPAPDPTLPADMIRSNQRFHQAEKGWADIAYHFLIGPNGEIFEGRHYTFAGDTGTDYDPAGHFLVSIDGNYSTTAPNDAQVKSSAALFAWAAQSFGISLETLGGHRDYAQTECPGDALYSSLGDIRTQAQKMVDIGIPQLSYS